MDNFFHSCAQHEYKDICMKANLRDTRHRTGEFPRRGRTRPRQNNEHEGLLPSRGCGLGMKSLTYDSKCYE